MGPTITLDPRTRADARRRPGQQGSILLMVLAVVLMLTIGVLGLLRMTSSTRSVADKLETDTRTLHQIDGRLEEAINLVRDNTTTCPSNVDTQMVGLTPSPFNVFCRGVADASLPDPPPHRTVDFQVIEAGRPDPVGLARVRINDEVNSERLVGHSIEVCDWLLGAQAVTEPFQGCS